MQGKVYVVGGKVGTIAPSPQGTDTILPLRYHSWWSLSVLNPSNLSFWYASTDKFHPVGQFAMYKPLNKFV